MKKIIILLLLVSYLLPTFGITIASHYCGNKRTSISIKLIGTERCACGSKKMKKNCCKTIFHTFNINDRQEQTEALQLNFNNEASAAPQYKTIIPVWKLATHHSFLHYHYLKNQVKQPLYLMNQTFRI